MKPRKKPPARQLAAAKARAAGGQESKGQVRSGGRKFTLEESARGGRKGGKVAHARGKAHEFTPTEAQAAGSKGGKAKAAKAPARKKAAEEAERAARGLYHIRRIMEERESQRHR